MKLFQAKSLRDQLRLAKLEGVSLDSVPTVREFDEDEGVIDPEASLRMSRFDRADYYQAIAAKAEMESVLAPAPVVESAPELAPAPSPAPDSGSDPS